MSQPKGYRKPTELQVILDAEKLLEYTISICSNSDVFPVRKRWALPSELYRTALDFCMCLEKANKIVVKDNRTKERRIALIQKAVEQGMEYEILLNIACRVFEIGKRQDHWIPLALTAIDRSKKWLASEIKRYK